MTPLHYHYKTGSNNSIALVSAMIFTEGSWFDRVKNEVIDNHLEFCRANKCDYYLFNKEIFNYSTNGSYDQLIKKYLAPNRIPSISGIQKIYAQAYTFDVLGYSHVIQVDTDSVFTDPFTLDFNITENEMTFSELYDTANPIAATSIVIAYLIAKGMSAMDIMARLKYFNNGGLLHMRKGLFSVTDVDDFCNFIYTFNTPNKYLHQISDESFVAMIMTLKGIQPKFFDQIEPRRMRLSGKNRYNLTSLDPLPDARHIHFIGNRKHELLAYAAAHKSTNNYGVEPDNDSDKFKWN